MSPRPSSRLSSRLPALAALAAATMLTLASCSAPAINGPEDSGEIELVTSTPQAVAGLDKLVWNLPWGEPTSLDPAYSASDSNSTIVGNVCESILRIQPDMTFTSGVGDVEMVDEHHYVITVTDGAVFSDGSPVTAEDIVFSLKRYLVPELASSWSTAFDSVKSIEATGDGEVTITLKQPDGLFERFLGLPSAAVLKAEDVQQAGAAYGTPDGLPVCTGPYQVDSWKKGESITLVENPNYWNAAAKPLTPEVEFRFITDAATATTAMQTGEIDGSFSFPIASIPQLSGTDGTIAYGPSLDLTTMMFVQMDQGPLADPRLREALTLAVDYDGITDGIFGGAATELRALTPKASWGYSEPIFQEAWDQLPESKTDLDRAKQLVEEAGAPTEPAVLSYPAAIAEAGQLATAIKDAGDKIGIPIKLNGQNDSEYLALYFDDEARKGTALMLWQGYMDVPEPVYYYQVYTSDAVFNASGFSDPEFDKLVKRSRTEVDDDTRARTITEAQKIYAEGHNIIPLASQYIRVYQGAGVTGAAPTQAYLYYPWAAVVGKTAE